MSEKYDKEKVILISTGASYGNTFLLLPKYKWRKTYETR